jgi:hypothetical protein
MCAACPDGGCKGKEVEGWSNRLMWRCNVSDGESPEQARMESYRYFPGRGVNAGKEYRWHYPEGHKLAGKPVKISSGQPYKVTIYIKLNTPGVLVPDSC